MACPLQPLMAMSVIYAHRPRVSAESAAHAPLAATHADPRLTVITIVAMTIGAAAAAWTGPPAHLFLAGIPILPAVLAAMWTAHLLDVARGWRWGSLTRRLGTARTSHRIAGLVALAYLAVVLLPVIGLPRALWLGLVGAPHGLAAAHRIVRHPSVVRHIGPALGWMIWSLLLLVLGLATGFVLTSAL